MKNEHSASIIKYNTNKYICLKKDKYFNQQQIETIYQKKRKSTIQDYQMKIN